MVVIRILDTVLSVEAVDRAINVKKNAATVPQVLVIKNTDIVHHV